MAGIVQLVSKAKMEKPKSQIKVLRNPEALVQCAAERFVASAQNAIRAYGRFHVALSGGTTPKTLYALLAAEPHAARVDWSRVHVFWGDERCVGPDDALSNYRMAREALIDRVPLLVGNVHRIRSEEHPRSAAAAYERELRSVFRAPTGPPMPGASFDLVLLGIGTDRHTASLFPTLTPASDSGKWVMAMQVAQGAIWRVTCTPVLFNTAAEIVFLVAGAHKAAIVHRVLEGPNRPALLPAQAIGPSHGALWWLLDLQAAAKLADVRASR